jgi:hypothetical protein
MSIRNKNLIVIVSSPTGGYLATWSNVDLEGFSKEINGGIGECVIKLDKAFDYSAGDVAIGNDVEMRISDKDTVDNVNNPDSSRTIYRGYISLIEREVVGAREQVTIHLLGYYTKLSLDILKDGTQATLYSDATDGVGATSPSADADIGLMMRGVLDRYIAETTNPKIGYNIADIPDTATTTYYKFQQQTYRQAMDVIKRMAPVGYFYYIDETGQVKFGPKPTTPTHKFIFGRHFNAVKVEQSLEKVRNVFLIWNGESGISAVYKSYEDDNSISLYGRRVEPVNDYGIDNSDAADKIGAKLLSESKDPEIKVICTIIDNNESDDMGYDIESIQPGDTCSFYGFDSSLAEIFQDNMLITNVNYKLGQVEIQVEIIKSGLFDIQDQQGKEIHDASNPLIPDSYT